MRSSGVPVLIVVASVFLKGTSAQACAAGSGTGTTQEIDGNWYCSDVKAITYVNFPGHGYYNKVTNMDADTGECSSETYAYSGSLSPLNEELSLHVRGPVLLKQVAVYNLTTIISGREKAKRSSLDHVYRHVKHGHGDSPRHHWLHSNREKVHELMEPDLDSRFQARAVGDVVTATIDGKVVSWPNEYAGLIAPTAVAVVGGGNDSAPEKVNVASQVSQTPVALTSLTTATAESMATKTLTSSQGTSSTGIDVGTDSVSWARQAYYNADQGTSEGITFLNHFGGMNGIPGTAAGGSAFGASLSYASSDGQSGAASPQILSNVLIEDQIEVIIMSNKSCEDGECGYTRPGGVAYHGFSGDRKLFIFEFSMPFTGKRSFNDDMPAIWLHNAQIPLTSQYGTNPECSCWTSGCGEFDVFEVLDPGDFRCKSTLHMAPGGGSSDWFMRPSDSAITAVVAFAGENKKATIRILDEATNFGDVLSAETVDGWLGGESSVFTLSA